MTLLVGGLRARMVRQSLFNMVHDSMAALGWFDAGRQHLPVTFRAEPLGESETVALNTIALVDSNIDTLDSELGSLLAEHRWTFYIDVYAEDNSMGVHLSYDIKSILEGRMPSISRSDPSFVAYDYRSNTPFATCQIENVMVDKAQGFSQAFKQNWYSLAFTVIDTWADETY